MLGFHLTGVPHEPCGAYTFLEDHDLSVTSEIERERDSPPLSAVSPFGMALILCFHPRAGTPGHLFLGAGAFTGWLAWRGSSSA